MENKKWDLVALASIPLIMTLGNSMLIPILPQISKVLGISSFKVSMLITVYAVVAILLIPIAGYLSDRYGRKKIIIPSLIIAALGGAVSAVAAWLLSGTGAYYVILAGRFLQGIGAAGPSRSSSRLSATCSKRKKRLAKAWESLKPPTRSVRLSVRYWVRCWEASSGSCPLYRFRFYA